MTEQPGPDATFFDLPHAVQVRAEHDLSVEQYVEAFVVPFVERAVASGKPVVFGADPWSVPDDGVLARQVQVLAGLDVLVDRDVRADGTWHAVRRSQRTSGGLQWAGWCADAMVAVLGDDVEGVALRSGAGAAEGVLLGAYVVTVGVREGGAWARLEAFGRDPLPLTATHARPEEAVRDVLGQARQRAASTLPQAYLDRYARQPRGAGTFLRGYQPDGGLADLERALGRFGADAVVRGRREDEDVVGLAVAVRRRFSVHLALRGPERALARSVEIGAGRSQYTVFGGPVRLDSAPASVDHAVAELAEWVELHGA